MKIGYLIPNDNISGGIAVVCQHANRLQSRGHDLLIINQSGKPELAWFPNQNVPIIMHHQIPNDLDLLVATSASTSFSLDGLPAKHKCYFVQSDESRFYEAGSLWESFISLSYLFKYHYLTEARWIQDWLARNFYQQAELIPNGLDQDIFYPGDPIQPKGQKPRILLEGSISQPFKGMADAFTAVQEVDAEVWCVSSSGSPRPDWRCDRFFEQVSLGDMRRIYSSCDVLLKMSRVEGFFGPPMEMMACGGAVVVGKVTGYDEYIIDGNNGLVIDPGDICAARSAIERILDDENLKQHLVKNGLKTINQWQWEPSIDKLEGFFQNILLNQVPVENNETRKKINRGIAYAYQLVKYSPAANDLWQKPIIESEELSKTKPSGFIHQLTSRILSLFNRIIKILRHLYHFIIISISGLFDNDYYFRTYEDVTQSGINPLWHYISIGWKEGRNPSPLFDTKFYLSNNHDVLDQRINPLIHYMKFGKKEGRKPLPGFKNKIVGQ